MNFRAAPSRGGWIGLALLAVAIAVEAGLIVAVRLQGLGPRSAVLSLVAFVLLPLVAWLAYWVWGYFSLRYNLTRQGLVIHWAANRQIVPMKAITHVLTGREYAKALRGFHWPGHEVGRTQVISDDDETWETLVYATTPPAGQLLIATPDLAYAISPADRAAFIEEFRVRRRMGPVQLVRQETVRPVWAALTLWRDGWMLRLIALTATLNALAFAHVMWHYPSLPDAVAWQLRYDPLLGVATSGPLRPTYFVWTLPLMGFAILAANLVIGALAHSRSRLAAAILAIGALLAQMAVGVALLKVGA